MNGLKVLSPLLILSAVSHPVHAATEFEDSVPIEVVNQLLGSGFGQQARIYQDILDGFPPFALPVDMMVLASIDQGFAQRVILKTDRAMDESATAAYGAFVAEGWIELQIPGPARQQTGFVSAQQPVVPRQLCHDAFGMMSIGISEVDGARYVNLMRSGMQPGGMMNFSCEQVSSQGQRSPGMSMMQYVPRLVMPASTGAPSPMGFFSGGGGGGSGNDWETRGSLNSDLPIDEAFEHFAAQIGEQDWAKDADVIGAQMAVGSWTKTVEGGIELIGSLTVLMLAEDTYDLRFRLVRKGQQGSTLIMNRAVISP